MVQRAQPSIIWPGSYWKANALGISFKEFALGEALLALFPFLLFFVRLQRFTVALNQPGEAVAVEEKDVSGIGRSGLYATTGAEDVSHGLFRQGVALGSLTVIVGYTYECTASQKAITRNT